MVIARQAPPLIVPRCIVELGLQDLLSALETHAVVADMIVEEVKKQGLEGGLGGWSVIWG